MRVASEGGKRGRQAREASEGSRDVKKTIKSKQEIVAFDTYHLYYLYTFNLLVTRDSQSRSIAGGSQAHMRGDLQEKCHTQF